MEDIEQKPHVCDNCYLILDSEHSLESHRLTCTEQYEATLSEEDQVSLHESTEDNDGESDTAPPNGETVHFDEECEVKPILCGICFEQFPSKNDLDDHIISAHSEGNEEIYVCDTCHLSFTSSETLAAHKIAHDYAKGLFMCYSCKIVFFNEEYLKKHLESHGIFGSQSPTIEDKLIDKGERSNECEWCKKLFTRKSELVRHIRTHTGEKPFKCSKCEKAFTQKWHLNSHMKVHNDDNSSNSEPTVKSSLADGLKVRFSFQKSQKCEEGFPPDKVNLDKHTAENDESDKDNISVAQEPSQSTENGAKQYKCPQCEKPFKYRSSMKAHMRVHTGEKPYQCIQCDQSFTWRSTLIEHVKVHLFPPVNNVTQKKTYECNQCGKGFKVKSHLTVHYMMHSGEKPVKCDMCDKSFRVKSHLVQHKRIHTGEKPYQCELCLKSFTMKSHLTTHMRIHSGEKPFKCGECGKAFRSTSHLTVHMRSHSGDKPYQCEHCEKAFKDKSHLVEHRRIHTGERPYQCEHCSKTFKNSSHLAEHRKTHSGAKPHKCDYCDKFFRSTSHLTEHKRLHFGDKPFQCELCEKTFTRKSHLNVHARTHTGERPYECRTCGKTFITSSHLKKHTFSHESDTQQAAANMYGKNGILVHEMNPDLLGNLNKNSIHLEPFSDNTVTKLSGMLGVEEKPKICDICLLPFGDLETLKSHKATHNVDDIEMESNCASTDVSSAAVSRETNSELTSICEKEVQQD